MKDLLKRSLIAILTFEARMLLKRTRPRIIAITGSVGKTSTKDAIYAVLKNHVHARKSQKSFNSDIGVALTVLGLQNAWSNPFLWIKNIFDGAMHAFFVSPYPDVLILEMGVDRPGDMKRLTQWITPDVVVVTTLPDIPVHVEYFSSPQEIIDEKMVLVHALKQDGILVYNNDDQKIHQYLGDIKQQSFGFSRYSLSHFTASHDTVLYDGAFPIGLEFVLTHIDAQFQVQATGTLGVQQAYTYAAAVAVGTIFDITVADAVAQLKTHTPPSGRMRVIKGLHDTVLIDDTYNSSPIACEQAIQTLSGLRTQGRKIAVLGDMLELGQFSVREHERVGEFLANKVDVLVTLGVRARKIAETAHEFGFKGDSLAYDDAGAAAIELKDIIKKGDIILVKASQSMRAEKIVAALMQEPQKAQELLVRQESMWSKKQR